MSDTESLEKNSVGDPMADDMRDDDAEGETGSEDRDEPEIQLADVMKFLQKMNTRVQKVQTRIEAMQLDLSDVKQKVRRYEGDSSASEQSLKRAKRAKNRQSGGSAIVDGAIVIEDDLSQILGKNYKKFVDVLYPVILAQHGYDGRGQRLDRAMLQQSCEVVAPLVFGEEAAKGIMAALFPTKAHSSAHDQFVQKLSTRMTGTFKVKYGQHLNRYDQF